MTRIGSSFGRVLIPFFLLALAASTAWAEGDPAAGKKTFDTLCATCHGPLGKGDGPAGAALNPKPRDFSVGDFKYDADKDGKPGGDGDLKLIVKQGAAAFGGSPLMAPWSHLTDKDLADVVAYVRTLHK